MNTVRRSVLALVIAVAFMGTYAFTHAAANAPMPEPPALASFPLTIDEWEGEEAPELAPDVAKVLAADVYLHRYYESDAGFVEMDVAYYSQRRVGASMHSPLNCLPGNGWTITDSRTVPVQTSMGTFTVQELVVKRRATFLIAYWYQNRNQILTGETSTRIRLLTDSLKGRPADVGLVRVITPLSEDEETAGANAVTSFASVLIPELARAWR